MVADAILDRLIHNSYRLVLNGESMRRHKTVASKGVTAPRHPAECAPD
ncbi:MAG: ATP-binding protein [Steroidobacteraceae bacterium]